MITIIVACLTEVTAESSVPLGVLLHRLAGALCVCSEEVSTAGGAI